PGKRSATGREGGQCGAVWWPHPPPHPPPEGANTKKTKHHLVFRFNYRYFKTKKKQNHFFIKKKQAKKHNS
ncbi:hypothetical protein, partial [Enterobacter intestinihominis]